MEEALVMKEEVGLYIPGEALGNGMSEPMSQTGASVRQWHYGKSSQRLQVETEPPRGSQCKDISCLVKSTESRSAIRVCKLHTVALVLAALSGLSSCHVPGLFSAQHPESPFSH